MDRNEELLHKKQLALSPEYQEIRRRLLDFMVSNASQWSEADKTRFNWWLLLLQEVDNWVDECDQAIEKAQKKKENY